MVISMVGVVVPACNEEALLPACLDALARAMDVVVLPTRAVVVLDDCQDSSAATVRGRRGFQTLEISARNVGRARAAGFEAVLKWASRTPPEEVWLASTDADSTVPPDWLTVQLEYAARGFEAVLGTVQVVDWSERSPAVAQEFSTRYQSQDEHHHVHGANMGMTAAAYLGAGGVPPIALAEDHGLAQSLSGKRLCRTGRIPVTTSSRVVSRAMGGFAGYLDSLPS
ncbi:MAG TPA: glycosyltransferase [Candidatus Dormibacteraeota bacterium]|nr:glycosyltransferase [Candidatus Dormibacteraeota bacterium]